MTTRLLVTGFGPFPTMPRNPSAALAQAVAASPRWRVLDVKATALILRTAYAALPETLDPALDGVPDALLMIGVAGRSTRVRVESQATGRRSRLFPDVEGRAATEAAPGAVHPRRTRAHVAEALRALKRRRVPAHLSRDAGRYLCNAAYFRALARPMPVLFVHIPKPARLARTAATGRPEREAVGTRLAASLVEIAMAMLRDARRSRFRRTPS